MLGRWCHARCSTRPERFHHRENEQRHQNPLSGEGLHAWINPHRIDVRPARDDGDRYDVPLLKLTNSLPHENESHVIQEETRDGEERAHWDADAIAVKEREDYRERDESSDDTECERQRDVRSLVKQRLVEERCFRALAIHRQERDQRQRTSAALLERRIHLFTNELLPF